MLNMILKSNKFILSVCMFMLLMTASCEIHRLDIQQGNIVTADMIKKVKVGMEKRQVQFVLGTPLINNPFDPNRWDYIYSLRKKGGKTIKQQVILYFKDDKLTRIEGDGVKPEAFDEQ